VPGAEGAVEVRPVAGREDLDRFIRLPMALQGADPHYIPPLVMERREAFDPKRNPLFRHAEVQFFLAWRGGRPVGRISAQVDRLHLERYRDATGHIGLVEGIDDPAVFAALTGAAEAWLRARGMRRATGPFNLSINEETGLLVAGFDRPPCVMMGHAQPHYRRRLEEQGYVKARDLIAYWFDLRRPIPPAVVRVSERGEAGRLVVRAIDPRRYREDVRTAIRLFNAAWAENWSFIPFTPEETDHMAASMKMLIERDMVCIAELDGEPSGFGVGLPNLNEAIRDLGGRLFPFGIVKLLWRLKVRRVRSFRVPLMGVDPRFKGSMAGAGIVFKMIEFIRRNAMAKGYDQAELSWILEDNMPMRRIIEGIGAEPYKTYRVYEKALA